MARAILRSITPLLASVAVALALTASSSAPADAQGRSTPNFSPRIGGGGGGGFGRSFDAGPMRRDRSPGGIPGLRGVLKEELERRPKKPKRNGLDVQNKRVIPPIYGDRGKADKPDGKGGRRPGTNSADLPGRDPKKPPRPPRDPGTNTAGTNSNDGNNNGHGCRRRGGCDTPPPDRRFPRRPPIIIGIPVPPPVPPGYIDDSLPDRPKPVYEPSSPNRQPRVPQRVDRLPPPPPPPAAFTPTAAPIPPRRALATAERPQFRLRELLVTVQAAEPNAIAQQLAQAFNIVVEESQDFTLLPGRRVFRFSIPDNRAVETVATAVSSTPGVTQASPNFAHYLQGATSPQSLTLQYALPKLRVPDTLDLASGRGVTVAVIDSGVDVDHPALKRANITFYDAVDGGVKAPDRHGTAITGIIAGQGDMIGIAPRAKILAMRAFAPETLGAPPSTNSMALARATDTAFANGARVFNMSFAGPRDPLLIELIDSAYEQGAVFIAAAGNQGPKAPPAYPAAYEKVIGITATDEEDGLYALANRGSYVSVAAPGVDILVPVTGKALDYMSGTSVAAAHVTGIVALLMERNPKLTPEEVRKILSGAAHDLGVAGPDNDFGAGLADAYGALMMANPVVQSRINP